MMVELNSSKLITYFLVISSVFSGVTSKEFRFHLPWACSVLHEQGGLIGACTIFEANKVLVSVENFNETVPGSNPPGPFYEKVAVGEIYVHAGSNYMNVDLVKPKLKYAQKYKAIKLYVLFKKPKNPRFEWEIRTNPPKISPEVGAEFDVFGLDFNIGILEIQDSFIWSPYVQPVLIVADRPLGTATNLYSGLLQARNIPTNACVTYSWSHKLNRIRYHEVMYVRRDNCLDLFCEWKLRKCWQFPDQRHLKCFKSTKFADVCPTARGAALYCSEFHKSVFAILTTAPSCGLRNMPGVYSTLPRVVEFYEKAFNRTFDPLKRPKYDLYSLQQRIDDNDGVL